MYTTLALCGFMLICRLLSEVASHQNLIVFLINISALGYVFNIIISNVYSKLKERREISQFCEKQFIVFKRNKNCFWGLLIAIWLIYIFFAYKANFTDSIGGIINDAISIVALGFSIEDKKITEKLIEHYENMA